MKKKFLTCLGGLIIFLVTVAFMTQSSTGIQGYAGSPGEATCSSCHGGGFSSSSAITINSTPAFDFNDLSEMTFTPDSVYKIDIEVTADGFSKFGFASQILSSSLINSGTVQTAGQGVKFLNSGLKRTAVHTTPKVAAVNTVTFSYHWTAPHDGDATIYAIANAVNGNGNTNGDFVLSPVSMPLVAAVIPEPPDTTTTTGMRSIPELSVSGLMVYPNPSKDFCKIRYSLAGNSMVLIQLFDSDGKIIEDLFCGIEAAGLHLHSFSFSNLSEGSYMVKLSTGTNKFYKKVQILH